MHRKIRAVLVVLAGGAAVAGLAQAQAVRPFVGNVETLSERNQDFRHEVFTGEHAQLVLMSLRPGENIGAETHQVDQCLFIIDGEGETVLDGQTSRLTDESVVCVPAGTRHDIRNTGQETMKLFTVYSPPEHPEGTVHPSKADAQRAEQREPQ